MEFGILLIFILASPAAANSGLSLLFPDLQREYTYVVKTNVSSGTLAPGESGTYWTLEGKLTIQVYDNYTRSRLRLAGLKKAVCCKDTDQESNIVTPDVPCITEPWELDYEENGYISAIYVAREPMWCTNLKRAISINFQITKNSGTYSINEPCLDQICAMVYTTAGNTIKKYTSYKVPAVGSGQAWSSVPWAYDFAGRMVIDSVSSAERFYILDDDKGLMNLDLRGSFHYRTHNHILVVTSDLSLYYESDMPAVTVEKLDVIKTNIHYKPSNFSNPSNGIWEVSQEFMMNSTYEILIRIATNVIDVDNIVRNPDFIHSSEFINLLNTISQLRYDTLIKLFENLIVGTSYELETARNIFLEILPHGRSEDCALLIKYIVLEEKKRVDNDALVALIRKLPFNLASRSQNLLEELEIFSKLGLNYPEDIRYAGILSFGTLLNQAMEASLVKQDYFDNIVVKFFKMYGDCPNYLDRMMWLQGLCNMGFSAEYYMRIVHADSSRDRHERFWAAFAAGPNTEKPHLVLQSTLPILTNETEFIQLRIQAVHMFLSSNNVRETDFMFVHNYIMRCNNNQLRRFWLSTMNTLNANKYFTGYKVTSGYAPFAANVPSPDALYWATNNYIISSDEENSPSLQVLSIGDSNGAFPVFLGFKLATGGRRPFRADVYLVLDGVASNIFNRFYAYDGEELNVEELVTLLKNIHSWRIKTTEKVHIDVVIKLHDKTIYATHMNQTSFQNWNAEALISKLEDFLRFGSHINQQTAYYPFQMDVHLPSELGTPIRLHSTIMSFTSLRGTFSALSPRHLSWTNDLHIRYQGTSVTSLSTYGPLVQTSHTASIQQSIVAYLPMNFNVSFPNIGNGLDLTWPNPGAKQGGVAMHSRAQVSMEIMSENYGKTVTLGGEHRTNQTGIFFDCDEPMTISEVLDKLSRPKSYNLDLLTSVQPSLVILNSIVMFARPPSGSCGVILPPEPLLRVADDVLQVRFTLDQLTTQNYGTDITIAVLINYFNVNDPSDVVLKMDLEMKMTTSENTDNMQVTVSGEQGSGSSKKNWTFCLREQEISHTPLDQDISSYPGSYEGHVTLTFTNDKAQCFVDGNGGEITIKYRGLPKSTQGNLERYFEVNIFGRNLSELGLDSEIVRQTAVGHVLRTHDQGFLNASAVIKEKDGIASISVNKGPEMQFEGANVMWIVDYWNEMQLMKSLGLYRECRLQETAIQTLFGAMEQLPSTTCSETLVLADCIGNQPRFAIFRLKNGGIKMYTGGYYIMVTQQSEDQSPSVEESHSGSQFWVTRTAETVKIISRPTSIEVQYRWNETAILIPHFYMTAMCGACMNVDEYTC